MAEPVDEEDEKEQHERDQDTLWLGWAKDASQNPILAEYGRYASIMMETEHDTPDTRYPSLVSFVGQTDSGKSTLIRLLMDADPPPQDGDDNETSASVIDRDIPAVPVTERNIPAVATYAPIIGRSSSTVPTSADVHLYLDCKTIDSERPILFADCEGFQGGEGNPTAIEAVTPVAAVINDQGTRSRRKAERALYWGRRDAQDHERTGKRQYAICDMYPRIFHAFSDVMVFVVESLKRMEDVVDDLLKWADKNQSSSIKIPSKPHAVIVVNKSDNNSIHHDEWARATTTEDFLKLMDKELKNPTFEGYVKKCEGTGHITRMRELFECYYAEVHVIIFPRKSRYQKLHEQRNLLYRTIVERCENAFNMKKDCHMLADVDQLSLYLSLAFDQFSRTLDESFDYVQASLNAHPPPEIMRKNVRDFAEMIAEKQEPPEKQVPKIFASITDLVASSIMLDATRKQLFGRPLEWFRGSPSRSAYTVMNSSQYSQNEGPARKIGGSSYHALCRAAVSEYYTKMPCKLNSKSDLENHDTPATCRLYCSMHPSEQAQDAGCEDIRNFAVTSDLSLDRFDWAEDVRNAVIELFANSGWRDVVDPRKACAESHAQALKLFYGEPAVEDSSKFMSNTICLCCLLNSAQYQLSCGHAICFECVQDYGTSRPGMTVVDVRCCPLHTEPVRKGSSAIFLIPPYSGLRVLTLDGGGIRGIVELCILKRIETRLKVTLNNMFDLVVGTSTGGIIALGFGHKRWSVDECTGKFRELVNQAFTKRQGQHHKLTKYPELLLKRSRYETKPLESALMSAFGEQEQLFPCNNLAPRTLKVAVTTTTAEGTEAQLFPNYNVGRAAQGEPTKYKTHRPGNLNEGLKVWEAARATSAAPGFFRPFERKNLGTFMDGAFLYNNPIEIATDEADRIATSHRLSTSPDVVVSLGTCCSQDSDRSQSKLDKLRNRTEKESQMGKLKAPVVFFNTILRAVKHQVRLNIDSERKWVEWSQRYPNLKERAVRVNPNLGTNPPSLDEKAAIDGLEKGVTDWLDKHEDMIRDICCRLAASSFYFERAGHPEKAQGPSIQIRGHIRCRLSENAEDIKALGSFLEQCTLPAAFVLVNFQDPDAEVNVPVQDMISDGMFQGAEVVMTLYGEDRDTLVALKLEGLGRERLYPVSGFPRNLMKHDFGQAQI